MCKSVATGTADDVTDYVDPAVPHVQLTCPRVLPKLLVYIEVAEMVFKLLCMSVRTSVLQKMFKSYL